MQPPPGPPGAPPPGYPQYPPPGAPPPPPLGFGYAPPAGLPAGAVPFGAHPGGPRQRLAFAPPLAHMPPPTMLPPGVMHPGMPPPGVLPPPGPPPAMPPPAMPPPLAHAPAPKAAPAPTPAPHAARAAAAAAAGGAAAAPPAAADAADPPSKVWLEVKGAKGELYWHNRETGVSTYEKPEELWTTQEKADASTGWREYEDADGKAYFHHEKTDRTVWQIPEELKVARNMLKRMKEMGQAAAAAVGAAAPAADGASVADAEAAAEAARPSSVLLTMEKKTYATKAEAKEAFQEALLAAGVRSTDAWEKVTKMIAADPRAKALPSAKERRAAAKEWQDRRRKVEAEEARKAEMAARQRFAELLGECKRLDARMSAREASAIIAADDAFGSLRETLTQGVRDDIYLDWASDKAARDAARQRAARSRARDAFRALCAKAFQDAGGLDGSARDTEWRALRRGLEDAADNEAKRLEADEGESEMAVAMAQQAAVDRMEVYGDVVRDAYKMDDDHRADERVEGRRRARKARLAFVALLGSLRREGKLRATTRWEDAARPLLLVNSTEYDNVSRARFGSTPRELYEGVREELLDELCELRRKVDKALEGEEEIPETVAELRAALDAKGKDAAVLLEGWCEADLQLGVLEAGRKRKRSRQEEDKEDGELEEGEAPPEPKAAKRRR